VSYVERIGRSRGCPGREPGALQGVAPGGGRRRGLAGRIGAGAFVKPQFFIAALAVSAALAFAGSSEASDAASSPPAPLRAAASPRHSVAGASATATHATRTRHKRKHHRHHTADRAQLSDRNPMSATGGSPSQPVRHVPHHHAALRPSSHEYRQHARSRTGSHGQQAVSPGSTSISTATARLDLCSLESPSSHIEMVNLGRGPPRAGPRSDLTSASQVVLSSTAFPTYHPLTIAVDVSRDRLMSRPHPVRLEGAAVCSDCPP
jgi:hypothetical protein